MSSQSILHKNRDIIQEESEKTILKYSHYYMLYKRFGLGRLQDKDRTRHALKFLSFICTENCELIDFINKKLNEVEEDSVLCTKTIQCCECAGINTNLF